MRTKEIKENKGITLMVLVITIIILLILAGITIGAITGENGIIKNAGQSKEQTEIANEKEIVEKATVEAMGKNKYGNIEEKELQNALNQETGDGKTEAVDTGEEFEVLFIESNRYYIVDKDGNVGEVKDYYKDENPGDITIGENGETLDGSEEHPYEIGCIEDLVAFSNMSNGEGIRLENGKPVTITKKEANNFSGKYIVLKRDLNFKSKLSYADSERTDFGDINGNAEDGNTLMNEMTTGTGFRAIGSDSSRFSGIFNGNYKEISNIYENLTSGNLGLFSVVQSTTIQNLSIQGEFTVYNENNNYTNSPAAGVVAFCWGTSSFKNCSSNVNIDSNGYGAGGIVGRADSTVEIINCSNLGKIENSSESTGGIAGRMEGTTNIYNSFNTGEISSTGKQAGGIVGYCISSVDLENVYNCGEISKNGIRGRGGIVGAIGNNGTVDINSSYNMGKVIEEKLNTSTYSSGAICGYRYDVSKENLKINNSYYLSNTCSVAVGNEDDSGYGITKLENMTNEELKNYLNEYREKNNKGDWKSWKLGENGYPTFE